MEIKVTVNDFEIGEFESKVISQTSQYLLQELKEPITKSVQAIIQSTINKEVQGIVEEMLTKPLQLTNQWGEPKGAPLTLKEHMVNQATKCLTEKVDDQGRTSDYERNKTRLEYYAHKVAIEAMNTTLQVEVNKAVADIRCSVDGKLKSLLEDALKKVVGIR
jgi:hypothetical protein